MNKLLQMTTPLELSGGKTVPSKIMPGPMEGVMSPLWCRTMGELKLTDFWITPFLRISTGVPKAKTIKSKFSHFLDCNVPTIVQLMGHDTELIAQTAERIGKMNDFLGVNLNYACPSKRVVSNKGGGNMLKCPSHMAEILQEIKLRTPNTPLSAKLRIGFDDHHQAETIIPAVCKTGVDFIMVHFRTVEESYKKIENGYSRLKRVVELADGVPVIGSGDIFSVENAKEMYTSSGCAGITVARGLIKNPYLMHHIKQGFSGQELNTQYDWRIIFYNKMIEIAKMDSKKYWYKGTFLEIANFMWGSKAPVFEKLKKLNKDELLNLQTIEELL